MIRKKRKAGRHPKLVLIRYKSTGHQRWVTQSTWSRIKRRKPKDRDARFVHR